MSLSNKKRLLKVPEGGRRGGEEECDTRMLQPTTAGLRMEGGAGGAKSAGWKKARKDSALEHPERKAGQ